MKRTFGAVIALVSTVVVAGQSPPALEFEVASIRRNTSAASGGGGGPRPGGRYGLTNVPTRTLIAIAYDLPSGRILGGPNWLDTDRYDITAIGKENPTREESAEMLKALLRDRFKLAARGETRDLDPARTEGRVDVRSWDVRSRSRTTPARNGAQCPGNTRHAA